MPDASAKPVPVRLLEAFLLAARWLLVPLYVGLALALLGMIVVFARLLAHDAGQLLTLAPKYVILAALSLIDLSLTANLLLIVVLSGYENFVSRLDLAPTSSLPDWITAVDFSGLKLKLMVSIVAISAIALLHAFVELTDTNEAVPDNRTLAWLIGLHLTFVVSAVALALTDLIVARAQKA